MDIGFVLHHPLMQPEDLPRDSFRGPSSERTPSIGSDSALESSPPASPQSSLLTPVDYGYMARAVENEYVKAPAPLEDEGLPVDPAPCHIVTHEIHDDRTGTYGDTDYKTSNIFRNTKEDALENFVPESSEISRVSGLSNVILLPASVKSTIRKLLAAIKYKDTEGVIEYSLQAFSTPFGIAHASADLTSIAYVLLQGIEISIITISSFVLGLIFLTVELMLETTRFIRAFQFNNSYKIESRLEIIKKLDFASIHGTTGDERAKAIESLSFNLSKAKPTIETLLGQEHADKLCGEIQAVINSKLPNNYTNSLTLHHAVVELQVALSESVLSMIYSNYLLLSPEEDTECHEAIGYARLLRILENNEDHLPPTSEDFDRIQAEFVVLFGEARATEFIQRYRQAIFDTDDRTGLSLEARAALFKHEDLLNAAIENKLRGKLNALARRIQPATALRLSKTMECHLFDHEALFRDRDMTTSELIDTKQQLLSENIKDISQINLESRKTMIIHAIGIAAITLGILSLTFSCAGFPIGAVAVIVILGIILQMYRRNAKQAFLDQDGYKWDYKYMIPQFIRSFFKSKDIEETGSRLVPLTFDREREQHVAGTALYGHNYDLDGQKLGPRVGSEDEKSSEPDWWHKIPYVHFFL